MIDFTQVNVAGSAVQQSNIPGLNLGPVEKPIGVTKVTRPIAPYSILPGAVFNIRVSGTLKFEDGNKVVVFEEALVNILVSKLVPEIPGGNRVQGFEDPLYIIGNPRDMDIPEDQDLPSAYTMEWKCRNINTDGECNDI